MKRYGLILVVLVLAVSSLLAAAAYNTAVVTNAATVNVVNTDAALLAMIPNPDHNAVYLEGPSINSKVLKVDFNRGYLNGTFGVQANSDYYWTDLYQIKNNADHTVTVTITGTVSTNAPDDPRPVLSAQVEGITVWKTLVARTNSMGTQPLTFTLAPNEAKFISMWLQARTGINLQTATYTLTTTATK